MKFFKPGFSTLIFVLFMFSCQKESSTLPNSKPAGASQIFSNQSVTTTLENFETGAKAAYAAANVTLSTGSWNFNDALLGNSTSDRKNGSQSARVRNSGILTTNFDYTGGASTVSIYHALFGSDASSTWQLWYSTNAGSTYVQAGSTITTSSTTLQQATFTINVSGNVRFEVRKTDGTSNRINFDDFSVTAYSGVVISPTLTSVSPDSASAGGATFTLTATGTNFASNSTINWNGTALTTTYVSTTKLTASIAATRITTAGTDSVSVATPSATTSASLPFYVKAATVKNPMLTSVSPDSTTAGGATFTLTATGSNFASNSTINWNGAALTTTYVSATKLTASIEATRITTAGTDSVSVATASATTSASLPFYVKVSTAANPTLTAISPSSANAGGVSFTITATGTKFVTGSSINWNGVALTTTFVTAKKLTATVPATDIVAPGTASVNVTTPAGGFSPSLTFTINGVVVKAPTLTSISPASAMAGGAAFTLTATGTNYTNSSTINWNGTALTTTFVSATKLTTTVPVADIATAGKAAVTVSTASAGTSAADTFTINTQSNPGTKRFLFDATHAETAGNADWVIDEDNNKPQRVPTPAQSTITSSTAETFWTGALSSWGIALVKAGDFVETLPTTGGTITYGNSNNAQDLSNYDVFVVDEPNTVFTAAEKTAILNFVNHGGGLFMISDHTGSDRNNDGWDSPAIWNDLMTNNTVQNNPFGFSIDLTNISQVSTNVLTNASGNVILNGSQGSVNTMEFNNGATVTMQPTVNANVQGLIWENTYAQGNTNVMAASSTYGSGRVFVVTDSSPMDDGTGASGNSLYVSWPLYSHTQLFMNASLWLAKQQ